MRGLKTIILGATVLLSACAPQSTRVSAVDGLYVKRLNGRLAQYQQAEAEINAELKRQLTPPAATTEAAATSAVVPPSAAIISGEISRASELHARAGMLGRFMHEAAASGQFGFMSSWVGQQITELIRAGKETDAAVSAFQRDAAADPKNSQLTARFYNLLIQRGTERGAGEELAAITEDLRGYQRDYTGAAAFDEQRRQENAKLLAAYLSAPRVTVTPPAFAPSFSAPHMPTFTSCMPNVFGSVNCTTQ